MYPSRSGTFVSLPSSTAVQSTDGADGCEPTARRLKAKGAAMALIWLTLGVVLLLAELRHYAFFAVFGAIGAFAAAVVALVWPDLVAAQLAAGVVVGGLGIWLIRPRVSSAFHQGGDGRLGRGVHGALIGEE